MGDMAGRPVPPRDSTSTPSVGRGGRGLTPAEAESGAGGGPGSPGGARGVQRFRGPFGCAAACGPAAAPRPLRSARRMRS